MAITPDDKFASRLAFLDGVPICQITQSASMKALVSPKYNYIFQKKDGGFARWGATEEDDPDLSPFGPEIADIELSTACSGITGTPCKFCYKSNRPVGENMSLETFKKVFAALPPTLTQIAFGLGNIDANPDLWAIFSHCRENDIVPNVTINGARMTDDYYGALANLCGAVAVSRYDPKDVCYDAVEKLAEAGLEQVNIHQLLCEETYESCFELIEDVKTDPRLKKLRAIVFLGYKNKTSSRQFNYLDNLSKYANLVESCKEAGISIGFDSCSGPVYFKATNPDEQQRMLVEPCESGLFSIYCNVNGEVFPCSFAENTLGWEKGISLPGVADFLRDVWYHPKMVAWRDLLLASSTKCNCQFSTDCRSCPIYEELNTCKRED